MNSKENMSDNWLAEQLSAVIDDAPKRAHHTLLRLLSKHASGRPFNGQDYDTAAKLLLQVKHKKMHKNHINSEANRTRGLLCN